MNMTVLPVEQQPSEIATMFAIVSRAAADPAVDMDKLERLMAMQERAIGRQAELEFNSAMNIAQQAIGRIATDKVNQQTRSNYASYGKLDKFCRPVYTENGFSLSFDTEQCPIPEYVRIVCFVSHSSGHTRKYHLDMPADGKGAKGGDVMTKTHAVGSASRYGMRYLLMMIFNLAIGDEDDDGNAASGSPRISEEQEIILRDMIEATGTEISKFLDYMGAITLSAIRLKDFGKAKTALEAKARQRA